MPRVTQDLLACTWGGSGCNLEPLPPQSKVELSLSLERFPADQQIFFRVIAVDDGGKVSRSNRASIVLAKISSGYLILSKKA